MPVNLYFNKFIVTFSSDRYHQSNHSRSSDLQLAPDKEIFASLNEYRIPQRVGIVKFRNQLNKFYLIGLVN
jgi:hypothetical protein